MVQTRPGPGRQTIHYLDTATVIHQANQIFGFNGWCHQIIRYFKNYQFYEQGRYRVGYSAIVRVTLKNGCFHEAVGCGDADLPFLGQAIENSQKTATSDALKRCLKIFGEALGNDLMGKLKLEEGCTQRLFLEHHEPAVDQGRAVIQDDPRSSEKVQDDSSFVVDSTFKEAAGPLQSPKE